MSSSSGGSNEAGPEAGSERNTGFVQAAIIGITLVAATSVAVTHWAKPVAALLLAGLVVVAGWLSKIDFEQHRLPNKIVGPLAAAVTVIVLVAGLIDDDIGRSGRAVLFGLAATAVFFIGNLAGGIGMGDVKYAYPLGAGLGWFGLDAVLTAGLVTVLVGGLAAVVILASGKGRRYRIPYGPFMSVGLVVGLLIAAPGA